MFIYIDYNRIVLNEIQKYNIFSLSFDCSMQWILSFCLEHLKQKSSWHKLKIIGRKVIPMTAY